jgi:hypothetical protein
LWPESKPQFLAVCENIDACQRADENFICKRRQEQFDREHRQQHPLQISAEDDSACERIDVYEVGELAYCKAKAVQNIALEKLPYIGLQLLPPGPRRQRRRCVQLVSAVLPARTIWLESVGERTAGRLLSATSVKVGQGYRLALPIGAYTHGKGRFSKARPSNPTRKFSLIGNEERQASMFSLGVPSSPLEEREFYGRVEQAK